MQHLEVSGAVRHIYIVRQLRVLTVAPGMQSGAEQPAADIMTLTLCVSMGVCSWIRTAYRDYDGKCAYSLTTRCVRILAYCLSSGGHICCYWT